jgi:hypothetical protein
MIQFDEFRVDFNVLFSFAKETQERGFLKDKHTSVDDANCCIDLANLHAGKMSQCIFAYNELALYKSRRNKP